MILLENNELALYNLMGEIQTRIGIDSLDVEPVLGSVCDREAMFALLVAQKVDTIFHAAAYKHVHIVKKTHSVGYRRTILAPKTWRMPRLLPVLVCSCLSVQIKLSVLPM